MTATAYYVERDGSTRIQDPCSGWAIFCAPGDDGYPSRHVGTLKSSFHAERVAQTLQYIVREHGAAVARDCEETACRIGAYGGPLVEVVR